MEEHELSLLCLLAINNISNWLRWLLCNSSSMCQPRRVCVCLMYVFTLALFEIPRGILQNPLGPPGLEFHLFRQFEDEEILK